MPQISQPLESLFTNPSQIFADDIYGKISSLSKGPDGKPFKSQYSVSIISKNATVVGLLTNNLSLNLAAEWQAAGLLETITSNTPIISKLYPVINTVMNLGGIGDPNSFGVSSKKIYKQSGYLEFEVEFRVIDWQGTGEPVRSAFMLSTMCLPSKDLKFNIKEVLSGNKTMKWVMDKGKMVLNATDNLGTGGIKGAINWITNKIQTEGGTENGKLSGFINDELETLRTIGGEDLYVAAREPGEVAVQIGQYFSRGDMIVTGVNCDFSKSCTDMGPLYADFKLSLSSRHSLILDNDGDSEPEMGLIINGQTRRVFMENEQMNNMVNK